MSMAIAPNSSHCRSSAKANNGLQQRPQEADVIFRAKLGLKLLESNTNFLTDVVPVSSSLTELLGLGALITIGSRDADGGDASINKWHDQVAWCDLAHGFVEGISIAVGVALWCPEISALKFVAEGLILIDPPIAHRGRNVSSSDVTVQFWACPCIWRQRLAVVRDRDLKVSETKKGLSADQPCLRVQGGSRSS